MHRNNLLLILLVLTSCLQSNRDDGKTIYNQLIGGSEVSNSGQLATIQIEGCSGTKISSRTFITAAHCVSNGFSADLYDKYAPGEQITVHHNNNIFNLTVMRVSIPQNYRTMMERLLYLRTNGHKASYWASDVSIIHVAEETTSIPIAEISLSPVLDNKEIITMGNGCQNDAFEEITQEDRYLKQATVQTCSHNKIQERKDYIEGLLLSSKEIYRNNFLTTGKNLDSNSASICPGDSGGPAYILEDKKLKLVGINSYYLFSDGGHISDLNLHTRLNNKDLKEWLKSELSHLSYINDELKKIKVPLIDLEKLKAKIHYKKEITLPTGVAGITLQSSRKRTEKILGKPIHYDNRTEVFGYVPFIDIRWFKQQQRNGGKPTFIQIYKGYPGKLPIPESRSITLGEDISDITSNPTRFKEMIRKLYNAAFNKSLDFDCHESNECRWYGPKEQTMIFLYEGDIVVYLGFTQEHQQIVTIKLMQTDWK